MVRHQPEAESLQRRGQNQLHLHEREVVSNTNMRSFPKWIIMVTRATCHLFGCEALRVEGFGIVPVFRIAVCNERRDKNQGSRRNPIAVDYIFGDSFAG